MSEDRVPLGTCITRNHPREAHARNPRACAQWHEEPPYVVKLRIEAQVKGELLRSILVAMCNKQGISIVSPFRPDEEARNYMLAHQLGIGSVFGLLDEEGG